MRCAPLVVAMLLVMSSTVEARTGQSATHSVEQTSATPAPVARANQRLEQHRAKVEQLKQDVARQESDSRQAAERLQQQDQEIDELQKQLRTLHAEAATGSR